MYELLIVDDEASSREILATCFPWGEQGFHVCAQMDDGAAALAYVKTHTVHAVLSDISMPVMNGVELAKALWELPSKPMVIFLSAHDDFHYAQDAIRYGVRYYVLKPTNFSELREIFDTVRTELDARYGLPPAAEETQSPDEIIQKVMEYLGTNYQDASLSQLAEMLYLNPSYLSQLIKLKTDKNFSDLLTEARMRQAALLLKNPEAKIYNISTQIGYLNPNNFARAFKAYWGLTPTEYRNHEK